LNKGSKGGDEDGEEPARDENDFDDEEPERGEDSSLNAWMPHITLLCKVEKKNEGFAYM
jgi:hypothetical protein